MQIREFYTFNSREYREKWSDGSAEREREKAVRVSLHSAFSANSPVASERAEGLLLLALKRQEAAAPLLPLPNSRRNGRRRRRLREGRRMRSSVNRRRKIGPRRHFAVYYYDMPRVRSGMLGKKEVEKGPRQPGKTGPGSEGGEEWCILLFALGLANSLLSSPSQLPMRHCRLLP